MQSERIGGHLLRVTLRCSSHDLNTLERRDNELPGHIKTLFAAAGRRVVAPFPYWRWVKLPADRAAERSTTAIHAAVQEFIAQARKRMLERPELREAPENFLESMLAAQETEGTFTDEEIIWNTLTFLSAGGAAGVDASEVGRRRLHLRLRERARERPALV